MIKQKCLCHAIKLALATSTGLLSTAIQADNNLEEVTVTATKRLQNLQDVPFAVTVLGEEQLDELNVANFDDYIRYLPGVNSAGRGPGQSSIFIRGMATDSSDQTSIEIGAPVPNVALYLDEQPVSSGGRNLDLYAADIARVEVLPGPQGTLFGASSMAGTIRLITNKPRYNAFHAGFKASVASTRSGDPSNSVETYFNWPLIDDRLAIRGVFYNAVEGGYIDNVYGENAYTAADVGFPAGAESTVVNNLPYVQENFNDAVYTGGRVSLRYAINPDWELLGQYMFQALDVDGVFDHSPEAIEDIPNVQAGSRVVGDLQVQRFFPDWLEDEFDQFSMTVNGRLGALDLVYAGSYLDREVNNSFDYSGYTQAGNYGYYYLCQPSYTLCGDPTQGTIAFIRNERTTHELRISSSGGERVNFVAGLFYDDIRTRVETDFYAAGSIGYFAPNRPLAGSTQNNPDFRPQGITFINDAVREEQQMAFFGEVTLDITDRLSVTAGARYYDIESSLRGSSSFANPCDLSLPCDATQDGENGRNYDAILAADLPLKESDTILKGTVTYRPFDDTMFFFTYSEGFRPGGFNRIEGVPTTYLADEATNYELGWKSTLLDGTLRFNASLYTIYWDELQVGITDFSVSVITFTTNAADAEIRGFEGDLTWLATDDLTLAAAWSLNDTEMVRVPPNVSDIAGPGSRLALAPDVQYHVSARYEWSENRYEPHAQLVYAYTGDQYSSIVVDNRFLQQSYQTVDASFGLRMENWTFELFGENLTDERAQLFINSLDTDLRITTNRPRTIGLKVRYDY
jgi:outer membrane receptor protein involved in Fe transport